MQKSIPFAKFHGLGNDWLVVGGEGLPRTLPRFARTILDRHTGVGADGLIVMMSPHEAEHAARARFFNADGSEAEMSGNGIRCAGAFLAELSPARRTFLIETLAGVKSVEKIKQVGRTWLFRVGMGAPVLDPAKIPFKAADTVAPVKGYTLLAERGVLAVTVTSMGNPHCSIFVQDFESIPVAPGTTPASAEGGGPQSGGKAVRLDWKSLGREIETSPLFPKRTNVEFVKVVSRKEIAVRFWERGVGHTLSSGTGSCAATVASILNGLTGRQVRVQTEAGSLQVAWPEDGEVVLTGSVKRVAEGTYYYR